MTWGRLPHVRWDELMVCRRKTNRFRPIRGKFAAVQQVASAAGRRPAYSSVKLTSAAFFGASRSVNGCPARRIARGLRTVPGDLAKGGGSDRSPSGGRETPPTFARREGFGRTAERAQRGRDEPWSREAAPSRQPGRTRWSELFRPLEPGDRLRHSNNDDRFVGCWAGSVGRRDPGEGGRDVAFGRQANSDRERLCPRGPRARGIDSGK